MARTVPVNTKRRRQPKRAASGKVQQRQPTPRFFRSSDHSSHSLPKAPVFGAYKDLLPAFASAADLGTDRITRPKKCQGCKMKPCLMLSHKTELRDLAEVCEDHQIWGYLKQRNIAWFMQDKLEKLLQKKVPKIPQCFNERVEEWFPDDLLMTSDDESEGPDADEEIMN